MVINREQFVPLAYFKRETYTGSVLGMRYWVKKVDDKLKAVVYPEPFCFEATPDEKKLSAEFDYTPQGREEVIGWLNNQYETRKDEWEKTPFP